MMKNRQDGQSIETRHKPIADPDGWVDDDRYFKKMRIRLIAGLIAIFVLPHALFTIYFHIQFTTSLKKTDKLNIAALSESQGNTIDLSRPGLMRDQQNRGVVNVAALAAEIKTRVADQLTGDKFTSAEFAVQMIEAPGEFTFTPQYRSTS